MNLENSPQIYLECDCTDASHIVRIKSSEGYCNMPPTLVIDYQLTQHKGFFSRLKNAVKYVLDIKRYQSDWDCTLVTVESADLLQNLVNFHQGRVANWWKLYGDPNYPLTILPEYKMQPNELTKEKE